MLHALASLVLATITTDPAAVVHLTAAAQPAIVRSVAAVGTADFGLAVSSEGAVAKAASSKATASESGGARESAAPKSEEPSLGDVLAFERRVKEVSARLREATVGLSVGPNQGSGVIVTADGIIASAGHLFERVGQRVMVTLENGRSVRGVTLGYNESEDYGLMRITSEGTWPYLPLHSAAALGRNEPCLAAGHPGGYQRGRSPVLRLGRLIQQRGPFLRTDCAIAMGDSGGPLVDLEGRVIGIHSRIRERINANYHVDAGKVLRDWERLLAGEVWGAETGSFPPGPILGVQVEDVPEGPRVRIAYADLPAARAGVLAGDILLSIDGQKVSDTDALLRCLSKRKAGEKVKVALLREGVEQELEVELVRASGGNR
ncbi:MAG: trypsin-like peptidase domain-containing protein [Planctomycetes bacterium]|nr:trypsin-like peptidase domain-containing protein [Planctomycetota bacterium]